MRPDEASRPELAELEALMRAKARQDVSHQRLDRWIAAAIAELSDAKTQPAKSQPAKSRERGAGALPGTGIRF